MPILNSTANPVSRKRRALAVEKVCAMDAELIKIELRRINQKLTSILQEQKKETWVGPSFIREITGWDREKLRQARQQHIIQYKPSPGGGWVYKVESIPQPFLIKKT